MDSLQPKFHDSIRLEKGSNEAHDKGQSLIASFLRRKEEVTKLFEGN